MKEIKISISNPFHSNKHGLKGKFIAKRCIEAINKGEKTVTARPTLFPSETTGKRKATMNQAMR